MAPTSPPDTHVGLLDKSAPEHVHVTLGGEPAFVGRYPPGSFRKVSWAIAMLVGLIASTYVLPMFPWGRGWDVHLSLFGTAMTCSPEHAQPWRSGDPAPWWNVTVRPFSQQGSQAEAQAEALASLESLVSARTEVDDDTAEAFTDKPIHTHMATLPRYQPHPDDEMHVMQPLVVPGAAQGKALDRFYAALARSDAGIEGAITRVVHWGDSAIGADWLPSAIRRRMQARFGDAGHGFHLMAPPNASYKHKGVVFRTNGAWDLCFIIERCRKDGHYGLGGTTFSSSGSAESWFRTATQGAAGRKVSRFELWYAGQPGGGSMRLRVDDEPPVNIDSDAATLTDRWHTVTVVDGPHALSVRASGGGKVRVYGLVMERDVPGVVWDELSLIGAFTNRLSAQDPAHFRSQVAHRKPDLAVFTFGGNDMVRSSMTMSQYQTEYREVLRLVRSAVPEPLPCLVMAPLDHGERIGNRIVTRPIVVKLVEAQRELAEQEGCAFFDTFAAMGGEGGMGRWTRSHPKLGSGDLAHLTHEGAKVMGEMIYGALMQGYVEYRKRVDAEGGDKQQ